MIGWIGAGVTAVVAAAWVAAQRAMWGGRHCDRHEQGETR